MEENEKDKVHAEVEERIVPDDNIDRDQFAPFSPGWGYQPGLKPILDFSPGR